MTTPEDLCKRVNEHLRGRAPEGELPFLFALGGGARVENLRPEHQEIARCFTFSGFRGWPPPDGLFLEVQRLAAGLGWQLFRGRQKEIVRMEECFAWGMPEQRVELGSDFLYHATTREAWGKIQVEGLLPGDRERATDQDRLDILGHIYACEDLGEPEDAREDGSCSAHWWRAELARKTSTADADGVILRLEVGGLEGVRVCQDLFSSSGVVIDGVGRIPPCRIRQIWPEPGGPAACGPGA